MMRLLALYRPYWAWVLLAFAVALATLLANMALMAVSGWFIAAMAIAGAAGGTMNYFTPAAIIRFCAITRTAGRYAERLVTHETTFRLLARLRVWLYRRIEPLPPAVSERFHSGDLASRLRADIDRLETLYLRLVHPLAVGLAGAAAVVAVIAWHAGAAGLIEAAGLAAAGLAVPLLVARAAAVLGRDQVRRHTSLTEIAVDGVQGLGELRAFARAGERHRARFAAASHALVDGQRRLSALAGLTQAGTLLAANLALWGVVVVTIPLVRGGGGLDRADLVMLAMLALAGFEAVAPLPAALLALPATRESMRRILGIADAPAETAPPDAIDTAPEHCDLRLSGVTFRYAPDAPAVLAALDLALPQGRRLAVVGPTGSGKSTLVALLTGLRRPDGGTIHLNGRPLAAYDPEALRRCFAVAPQHAGLFTGTIADNLRLARPQATEAELWRALETAQLAETVAALPEGLATRIGEAGLMLSGGQARRLAVARALLKPAPVLILDEPGEGLDYRTERAMLTGIVAALAGRSLLLITHRPAGLDLMDHVQRL